jgi:hypothetical protein
MLVRAVAVVAVRVGYGGFGEELVEVLDELPISSLDFFELFCLMEREKDESVFAEL